MQNLISGVKFEKGVALYFSQIYGAFDLFGWIKRPFLILIYLIRENHDGEFNNYN
jgi:hypothetical protein